MTVDDRAWEFWIEVIGGIATGVLTTLLFYFLPARSVTGVVFYDQHGERLEHRPVGGPPFLMELIGIPVVFELKKSGQVIGYAVARRDRQ